MLLTIAIILAILWLLGIIAFHITAWAIHIIIIVAIILVIVHFVRGRRTV